MVIYNSRSVVHVRTLSGGSCKVSADDIGL